MKKFTRPPLLDWANEQIVAPVRRNTQRIALWKDLINSPFSEFLIVVAPTRVFRHTSPKSAGNGSPEQSLVY
jgi:hypothetical protein